MANILSNTIENIVGDTARKVGRQMNRMRKPVEVAENIIKDSYAGVKKSASWEKTMADSKTIPSKKVGSTIIDESVGTDEELSVKRFKSSISGGSGRRMSREEYEATKRTINTPQVESKKGMSTLAKVGIGAGAVGVVGVGTTFGIHEYNKNKRRDMFL